MKIVGQVPPLFHPFSLSISDSRYRYRLRVRHCNTGSSSLLRLQSTAVNKKAFLKSILEKEGGKESSEIMSGKLLPCITFPVKIGKKNQKKQKKNMLLFYQQLENQLLAIREES